MVKGKGLHALINTNRVNRVRLDKYKIFKDAVTDAFEDEVLTRDEQNILNGMRESLGLTEDERDTIYDDVLEELGITIRIQSLEMDPDEDGSSDGNGPSREISDWPIEEAAGHKEKIKKLSQKLDMAENESSQAQWLIEQAQEERDGYKDQAEKLKKRVVELETRIDVLELTMEKSGIEVKKRPQTRPLPPKPADEDHFWELKRRQQTVPVPKGETVLKKAFCGFCGAKNDVEAKGPGEAIVFDCTGCGRKSFFRQD